MNAPSNIPALVRVHLRLYQREKYPVWLVFMLIMFLGLAEIFNRRNVLPAEGMLPFILSVIFMLNERFIVDPFSTTDGELVKLNQFPLQYKDVAAAKYAGTTIILLSSSVIAIAAAVAVLQLPLVHGTEGILFLLSALVPMFVTGGVFAVSLHVHPDSPALYSFISALTIGISSIPFIITRVLLGSTLLCIFWITASFIGAYWLIESKSEQWIIEQKFKGGDR